MQKSRQFLALNPVGPGGQTSKWASPFRVKVSVPWWVKSTINVHEPQRLVMPSFWGLDLWCNFILCWHDWLVFSQLGKTIFTLGYFGPNNQVTLKQHRHCHELSRAQRNVSVKKPAVAETRFAAIIKKTAKTGAWGAIHGWNKLHSGARPGFRYLFSG